MPEITVTEHLLATQMKWSPQATGQFTSLLHDLIVSAKIISRNVKQAGLVDILGGTGEVNVQGERVQTMIHTRDIEHSDDRFLFMVTRQGTVKRLPVITLKNLRNNCIRALRMEEGDALIAVHETDGQQKIVIATHNGQAVCFQESDVRAMGREAMGVRGIRLHEGDYVVGAGVALPGTEILSITEKGYGKRTAVEEYRITNRGGLGIRNYMITEKTGSVVGIKIVDGSEDLLLVTHEGILIRTPVDSIRTAGRATQGVIVMRFKEEGDHVIALALTEREEKHEDAAEHGEEAAAPAPEHKTDSAPEQASPAHEASESGQD